MLGALAHAYARGGQHVEAVKLVDELKRVETTVTPFGLIWAYAGLGENDQAFIWLERAYAERRDRMVWLNVICGIIAGHDGQRQVDVPSPLLLDFAADSPRVLRILR